MSAYIVPAAHINALVAWAEGRHGSGAVSYFYAGARRQVRNDAKRISSVLYAENVRSVNSRYKQCDAAHGFVYKPNLIDLTPVQVLKALDGYSYQACETADWEQSEAFAIVEGIRRAAINALPGYDAAETWSIDEVSERVSLFALARGRA